MATAIWSGMETIEGIITGTIAPETLPFAELSADEQCHIIDEIEKVVEDIEAPVIQAYPDLKSESQRAARVWEYRREFLDRTAEHLRDAYASHFDTLHGVLIRNGQRSRSYTIDDSGCVNAA
jgi:hypothetical protein